MTVMTVAVVANVAAIVTAVMATRVSAVMTTIVSAMMSAMMPAMMPAVTATMPAVTAMMPAVTAMMTTVLRPRIRDNKSHCQQHRNSHDQAIDEFANHDHSPCKKGPCGFGGNTDSE